MASAGDSLALKIVNVLVWIFLFGSNSYASVQPNGGSGTLSHITPADYAFYVWTIINALLLGMVVFQFFATGYEPVIEGIGWRFAIVGVLNALFAYFYSRHHNVIAFIISIFLAIVLSHIYYTLQAIKPKSLGAKVFIHLPFSLWHAWSLVLVILTGFATFGKSESKHAGVFTDVFVCIALGFLASTSVGYAFSNGQQGDIAGAAVIAWTLLAIFSRQTHPALIHWFALGSFIVSAFSVGKALLYAFRSGGSLLANDNERAPLIAGSD